MKLTVMLLFILTAHVSAYTYGQRIDIRVKEASLGSVLKRVGKQSGYHILFNNDYLKTAKPVTLDVRGKEVSEVLSLIFKDQPYDYRLNGNIVTLVPRQSTEPLSHKAVAQRQVRGVVTDSIGAPLEGVSVSVHGTSRSTITDRRGEFTLRSVPDNAVLLFTMVGFKSQIRAIEDANFLGVSLLADIKELEVAMAYGTLRKQDITGAASTITETKLREIPATSIEEAMQGRVAGLNVTSTSAEPGGGMSLMVRGVTSISGGNQPLFVIDGVPFYNDNGSRASEYEGNVETNVMTSLNPNDIVSVTVLKDADATAIYGSRGANGVILITTRRGKQDETNITANHFTTYNFMPNGIPLANAEQYAHFVNLARTDGGNPVLYDGTYRVNATATDSIYFPTPTEMTALIGEGTDWQQAIFRSSLAHTSQLSISSGKGAFRYSLSGNYTDQGGSLLRSRYRRGALRGNFGMDVSPKLEVQLNVTVSKSRNNRVENANYRGTGGGYERSGVIWKAFQTSPVLGVDDYYFDDEFSNDIDAFNIFNPLADVQNSVNLSDDFFLLSNMSANYRFNNYLSLTIRAGTTQFYNERGLYWGRKTALGFLFDGKSRYSSALNSSYVAEGFMTYKGGYGRHSFDAVVGGAWESNASKNLTFGAQQYSIDVANGIYLMSYAEGLDPARPQLGFRSSTLLSSYGRFVYNFDDRYSLSVTGRTDGSSRFAVNKKWTFFPSAGAAWNFTSERFLSNQRIIQNGKLRISYGTSGNQAIGAYGSLPSLGVLTFGFVNGPVNGIIMGNPGNTNLTWETTRQVDVGLEFGLFRNRIQVTADVYRKTTENLLQQLNVPSQSGYSSFLSNFGSIENKGFEVEVGAVLYKRKEFSWDLDANYSANRNKILDLGDLTYLDYGLGANVEGATHRLTTGGSMGDFFVYRTDGLLTSEDLEEGYPLLGANQREGQIKFVDVDENSIINDNDKEIGGNAFPKHIVGLNNTFSYRNFQLSFFFYAALGQSVMNMNRVLSEAGHPLGVPSLDYINDYWSPENTDARYPRPSTFNERNRTFDRFLEDGSFIRLRAVTLRYRLDVKSSSLLKGAQLYVTGNNLLTITKYKGFDPEVSAFGQTAIRPGLDRGSFPRAKGLSFGVVLNL